MIHSCPEAHARRWRMVEYAVYYFWLERKPDSAIGRMSDRLSEGAVSIPILVLWSFLINLLWLLRHIHVDGFALSRMCCPWTSEIIANVESLLTYISDSPNPHPRPPSPSVLSVSVWYSQRHVFIRLCWLIIHDENECSGSEISSQDCSAHWWNCSSKRPPTQ